jgi:hypothetical protein
MQRIVAFRDRRWAAERMQFHGRAHTVRDETRRKSAQPASSEIAYDNENCSRFFSRSRFSGESKSRLYCSRIGAKCRIASAHDIFEGQRSTSGLSQMGRFRSVANVLFFMGQSFDSGQRIFSTIAQDQRSKRFVRGIKPANLHDLTEVIRKWGSAF